MSRYWHSYDVNDEFSSVNIDDSLVALKVTTENHDLDISSLFQVGNVTKMSFGDKNLLRHPF